METDLDKIADGKEVWYEMLDEFYKDFEPKVEVAFKNMEKKAPEETGESCPNCNHPLVIKQSKYGKFTACSNYPECKYIKQNEELSKDGYRVIAVCDGVVKDTNEANIKDLDFKTPGIKKIEYSVTDKAGNTNSDIIYVTVRKDNSDLVLAGQVSIIFLTLVIMLFLVKYIRSIILEKRFSRYTINSSKNKSISLFDNLCNDYNMFINKISNNLSKVNFLKKISDKYNKYVTAFDLDSDTMKIISNKIVIGVLFIFGFIVINLFRSKATEPIELIIPFILGYYMLDIIYVYKYISYPAIRHPTSRR